MPRSRPAAGQRPRSHRHTSGPDQVHEESLPGQFVDEIDEGAGGWSEVNPARYLLVVPAPRPRPGPRPGARPGGHTSRLLTPGRRPATSSAWARERSGVPMDLTPCPLPRPGKVASLTGKPSRACVPGDHRRRRVRPCSFATDDLGHPVGILPRAGRRTPQPAPSRPPRPCPQVGGRDDRCISSWSPVFASAPAISPVHPPTRTSGRDTPTVSQPLDSGSNPRIETR